jgi:hypothetical protein
MMGKKNNAQAVFHTQYSNIPLFHRSMRHTKPMTAKVR